MKMELANLALGSVLVALAFQADHAADPLPSWNNTRQQRN
jgi:hypothetical protein